MYNVRNGRSAYFGVMRNREFYRSKMGRVNGKRKTKVKGAF